MMTTESTAPGSPPGTPPVIGIIGGSGLYDIHGTDGGGLAAGGLAMG